MINAARNAHCILLRALGQSCLINKNIRGWTLTVPEGAHLYFFQDTHVSWKLVAGAPGLRLTLTHGVAAVCARFGGGAAALSLSSSAIVRRCGSGRETQAVSLLCLVETCSLLVPLILFAVSWQVSAFNKFSY